MLLSYKMRIRGAVHLKLKKNYYIIYLILVLLTFVLFRIVFNLGAMLNDMSDAFNMLSSILSFFIYGLVISFILNPIIRFFEKRTPIKIIKSLKIKRVITLIITYMLFIGFITVIIFAIIPVIDKSIRDITNNFNSYSKILNDNYTVIKQKIDLKVNFELMDQIQNVCYNYFAEMSKNFDASIIFRSLSSTFSIITNFLFGIMISMYMLYTKESSIEALKKIVKALFPDNISIKILHWAEISNRIFYKYILGKFMASFIIWALCYIGFLILRVPNSLFFSLVIGITNMIPYIGPIIGTLPVVLLISLSDGVKGLWTLVFVLALQQLDAWIIGPKILGDNVGLSPLIIIAGLTIGGSIMGIPGMLIGIPIAAIIKEIFYDGYIERKTIEKENNKIKVDKGDINGNGMA